MLDLQMIDNTIEELENGDTNFMNCQKLASLYIIKQFNQQPTHEVETELNDILPSYRQYQEVKRHYQLGEVSDIQIINSLNAVCKEISEFLHILYSSTDTQIERDTIVSMIKKLDF